MNASPILCISTIAFPAVIKPNIHQNNISLQMFAIIVIDHIGCNDKLTEQKLENVIKRQSMIIITSHHHTIMHDVTNNYVVQSKVKASKIL